MAFRVLLSAPAERDIEEAAEFMMTNSFDAAGKWLDGLQKALQSLEEMPARHAVIAEAASLGRPYRSLPYFSHRIVYRVDDQNAQVYVVRVYHNARRPLEEENVETL